MGVKAISASFTMATAALYGLAFLAILGYPLYFTKSPST
jgi:hypothetical protein